MDKRVLGKVCLRSLLLQGTWNFERMQNLGFCYAIFPLLSEFYESREDMQDAARRHLEFFNTHPYMASPIIGAVAQMEEGVSKGRIDKDAVNTFKTGVMGSCGAIGDSLFWGSLKPFAAVAGVLTAMFSPLAAPFVFLLLYNVPHVWMRIFGVFAGYRSGPEIFDRMRGFRFTEVMKRVRFLTVSASGVILALIARGEGAGSGYYLGAAVTLAPVLLFWLAMKRGFSVQFIIYVSLFLAVGISFLG